MKLNYLFLFIIVYILNNVSAIGDLYFPHHVMRIEIPVIGYNISLFVKNCRYHYERNRVYCDWDREKSKDFDERSWKYNPYYQGTTYLSIPISRKVQSFTPGSDIFITECSVRTKNNEYTELIAKTSLYERIEVGDTYKPPKDQHFELITNYGKIDLYYKDVYVSLY